MSHPSPLLALLVSLPLAPLFGACSSPTTAENAAVATESAELGEAGDLGEWDSFGASVSGIDPVTLGTLLDDAQAYQGKTVVVEGPIEQVCQSKGCWMMLGDDEREMRVTFLDYGFFVPLDATGRTARVEGVFEVKEVPLETARHYLEDAGQHDEAAALTEPQESFTFVASGVLLK